MCSDCESNESGVLELGVIDRAIKSVQHMNNWKST